MIGGKRILVVDDEYLVAAMMHDVLHDAGAVPVGPAASVREALDLIAAGQLDAAVLDWNLSGEMSDAVARALRERAVPFLISTGYQSVGSEFDGSPLLAKPYAPEKLVSELGRLLEG